MHAKPFSYSEYLAFVRDSSAIKLNENSERAINRYRSFDYGLSDHYGVIFLVEFTTRKYIYISEAVYNIFGFSINEFKERTIDEYQSTIHPSDFEIMNRNIFPDNLKFLETIEAEKYGDYIFSYNYRVQNSHGDYITLLQRFSYLPSNKRAMPFGMMGVGFNISQFKNDLSVIHTIEETIPGDGELVNKLIFKKVYPIYDYDIPSVLTRKELEVLTFMSKGLASKQIAAKMNISINTVHNHRKSMLLKVNCNTSSELMNYAAKHGLI